MTAHLWLEMRTRVSIQSIYRRGHGGGVPVCTEAGRKKDQSRRGNRPPGESGTLSSGSENDKTRWAVSFQSAQAASGPLAHPTSFVLVGAGRRPGVWTAGFREGWKPASAAL